MRKLITILSLFCAMAMTAQEFRSNGEFTDDATGGKTAAAWLELALTSDSEDFSILKLMILPSRDASASEALVYNVWTKGAPYQKGQDVIAENYEERDIYYLYDFDNDSRLTGYYVFSKFVDTTREDFMQIAVRRFDADGKRVWCMTANSTNERARQFFKILSDARKKLRFKKTTTMKGDGRNKPDFREPGVNRPSSTIGRGSAYGTGW